MTKKYEMTKVKTHMTNGVTVFQIRALIDIPVYSVKAGDLGGFIESEAMLSHKDVAWVGEGAYVYRSSEVEGRALVQNGAHIENSTILGGVVVDGAVHIKDSFLQGERFRIQDNVVMVDCELRGEDILFSGKAKMQGVFAHHQLLHFEMSGNASIENENSNVLNIGGERIKITGEALLLNVWNLLGNDITIQDSVVMRGGSTIHGNRVSLSGAAVIDHMVTLYEDVTVSECASLFNSTGSALAVKEQEFNGDIRLDISKIQ